MGRSAVGAFLGVATAVAAWIATAGVAAAAPYKVAEIAGYGGYFDLNDRGQVFGEAPYGQSTRMFVFDSLGPGRFRIMDATTSEGDLSRARDDVFIRGRDLYEATTGRWARLDLPWPYNEGAYRADDAGVLYGRAWETSTNNGNGTNYYTRPFVLQDGTVRELPPPPGMNYSDLVDVNGKGDLLVGAGNGKDGVSEGFLLRDGAWAHLGTFMPTGLNERGDVLGLVWSTSTEGTPSASPVIVPADGSGMVALGGAPGAISTWPVAINNNGDIIANATIDTASLTKAVIYRDGVALDLNSMIDRKGVFGELSVRYVTAINELGQILAKGTDGYASVDMVLSPSDLDAAQGLYFQPTSVPEPSTLLVFGGLALGLGLVRRGPLEG